MRERELKLAVGEGFVIPSLEDVIIGAALGPPQRLQVRDTYFDTTDLRLARWGVTVRWRDGVGWTVKVPHPSNNAAALDRDEIVFEGDPGDPPELAVAMVASFTRGTPLAIVAELVNDRTRRRWHRADETLVAELLDDHVVATSLGQVSRFREVEIELAPDAPSTLLDDLLKAMALGEPGVAVPKLIRVLGEQAGAPPDVVVSVLGEDPTAAEVIRAAIASSVSRLICQVPIARIGVDPEGVHQARVATRRLRSDLRTFGPLLDADWAGLLRAELSWLADELGKVRDADVLGGRLRSALAQRPDIDSGAANALLRALQSQREQHRAALLGHLGDARAIELFEHLTDAAANPRTTPAAERRARKVLPQLVDKSWRRMRRAVEALPGEPTDEELHQIRILAKRVRYATEAVRPAAGRQAAQFAVAAAAIQEALGALNDAAVAEEWLGTVGTRLGGPAAFAAGRLAQQLTIEAHTDENEWMAAYAQMWRRHSWMQK